MLQTTFKLEKNAYIIPEIFTLQFFLKNHVLLTDVSQNK